MSCLYCDNRHQARGMCSMHYARWRRNGGPMVKHRNRGVLDAEPVPVLGPVSTRILMTLIQNAGRTFPAYMLHTALPKVTAAHIATLRQRYGADIIETVTGRGYRVTVATAARLEREMAS